MTTAAAAEVGTAAEVETAATAAVSCRAALADAQAVLRHADEAVRAHAGLATIGEVIIDAKRYRRSIYGSKRGRKGGAWVRRAGGEGGREEGGWGGGEGGCPLCFVSSVVVLVRTCGHFSDNKSRP